MPGDDSFFDVPTVTVSTSVGGVQMPIKYRDATSVALVYRVSLAAARAELERSGVAPLRIAGTHALASVTWFEYRDTSIGPYNELSVAVLAWAGARSPLLPVWRVVRQDARLGWFVVHLPVTTEAARAAGRELYGYPKTVVELPFSDDGTAVSAGLAQGGERAFSMTIPLQAGRSIRMPDLETFSSLEGSRITTVVHTDSSARVWRSKDVRLQVHDPLHPVAATLVRLGLEGKRALVAYANPLHSLLPLGEPMMTRHRRAA